MSRTLRRILNIDTILAMIAAALAIAYLIFALVPGLAEWAHRNVGKDSASQSYAWWAALP